MKTNINVGLQISSEIAISDMSAQDLCSIEARADYVLRALINVLMKVADAKSHRYDEDTYVILWNGSVSVRIAGDLPESQYVLLYTTKKEVY